MDEAGRVSERLIEEEKLVAELDLLGIRYLSRQSGFLATSVRSPDLLLADLVRQPSARVRAAVIALLLSRPEYASAVPAALKELGSDGSLVLRSFYLAAVLLQREYASRLRPFLASRWRWLPEYEQIAAEFDLPSEGTPREMLESLGQQHRVKGQKAVNWIGTYEQPASHLLRQLEIEAQWNR